MQRTPVIIAFFLAAALVGMFLRVTDMSGGKETFTLPSDDKAPIDKSDAPGISPYDGTQPIKGSLAAGVSDKQWEANDDAPVAQFMNNKIGPDCCPSPYSTGAGCICLTTQDVSGAASRYGNKSSM
jgi:hypothetical protein